MSAAEEPATAVPPRRLPAWAIVVSTGAVIGVLLGGYLLVRANAFWFRDAAGARACSMLSDWLEGDLISPETGKNMVNIEMGVAVGEQGQHSKTPAIRAAVSVDPKRSGLPVLADPEQIHAACESEGVDMPPWKG